MRLIFCIRSTAAQAIYFTGTHFFAVVPMTATIATITIINPDHVISNIHTTGLHLKEGIEFHAKDMGLEIHYTGHPVMSLMRFADGDDFSLNQFSCAEAVDKRDIFLYSHHNWFVCNAHSEDNIESTLNVVCECFKMTKEKMT
jgi:glutamate-1-semialdehyde aminotransferase